MFLLFFCTFTRNFLNWEKINNNTTITTITINNVLNKCLQLKYPQLSINPEALFMYIVNCELTFDFKLNVWTPNLSIGFTIRA